MKDWQYIFKIMLSIALLVILVLGGFYLSIVTFLNGQMHAFPLILAGGIIIYLGVNGFLFRLFRTKKRIIIFSISAGIALVATSIQPFRQAYRDSIPTVSAEVIVRQYEPFSKHAKLVRLDEPASLQLQKPLPNIDGATALYPLYAALGEAVYPEGKYYQYDSPIRVTKTSGAYERLSNGEADLIFAAAPNASQREQAGPELRLTPIGKEAFVFFVNRDNPVDSLSTQQIQDIYTGEVTNWRQVGGRDEPIRAFQRPVGSGSQSALERFMGDKPLIEAPEERLVQGMRGIIERVANYRNYTNSIGYSFRFFSTEMLRNGEIKLLAVDGVAPSKDSIRSGEYPTSVEFYAVTAGSENPNVEPFIAWILSAQGQEIVEQTGYVSLNIP